LQKSILIVDDSEIIRTAVRRFLEAETSFRVCGEAVDGLDALEKVQGLRPDLIILDLAMPRMNGFQTATQLRARMFGAPIILYTISAGLLNLEQVQAAGVNAVVAKEDFDGLRSHIETLLTVQP
jgi:two-component system, NarL family, nitrate/nitrite response regulator NarL